MAAIAYAIQTITRAGDNIVSAINYMVGLITVSTLQFPVPRYCGKLKCLTEMIIKELMRQLIKELKLYIANQLVIPLVILSISKDLQILSHKHGIPLIVDNTVATSYTLCRPIGFWSRYCHSLFNKIY